MKTESLKELNAISKIVLQKYLEDWKKCWHMCIISDVDYFEGDKINIDEYIKIYLQNRESDHFFPIIKLTIREHYNFLVIL